MSDKSKAIYTHATRDLGIKEVPGSGSHPRIEQAIRMAGNWLDKNDGVTAWCGCIRGLWGYETGSGLPKEHYRAASWLNWGRAVPKLKDCKPGDTLIFSRDGGNHVALFSKYEEGSKYVEVLGGNQSNSVSIAKYPITSLRGIRRDSD